MPVRYEESLFSEHCEDFTHLRNLARAFRAEAWLATSKNDFQAAARICIDTLELANAARRGGLVTDLLVGVAISRIAMDALRKIRTQLPSGMRCFVMNELQRLEAEREPFADIVARDRDWETAVEYEDTPCDFMSHELDDPQECGLSEEEQREILQLLQQMADRPESDRRNMQLDEDNHILALMRLLAIDLALRDVNDTTGAIPDELSSLAPHPFPRLPVDPYTEESFIYRRVDDGSYCLYSTGPKLADGGGQFGPWPSVAAGCADLCLDADDYRPDCCTLQQPIGLAQRITSLIGKLRFVWPR